MINPSHAWLTYLMHAKSTGDLISFGFSDRSVEVWSQENAESKRKKKLLFFLADLWSQTEFTTQWKWQWKTDTESELIHCNTYTVLAVHCVTSSPNKLVICSSRQLLANTLTEFPDIFLNVLTVPDPTFVGFSIWYSHTSGQHVHVSKPLCMAAKLQKVKKNWPA